MSAYDNALYFGRGEPTPPDPGGRLPTALVVPGDDSLALSTLGWQAVYRMLASEPGVAVERFFLDRKATLPGGQDPVSRDSHRLLSSFPVLAFSLTFEEEILQLLGGLKATGVPPRSAERPDFPLVLAGGPLAFLNPAPAAPFVDLFWVGEAEHPGFLELFRDLARHYDTGGDKQSFLQAVKNRPGVYVPGQTDTPAKRAVAERGTRLSAPAWSCFISDRTTFRDTLLLEANRGCPYGCRFCAAGYIYRPPRHADIERMKAIVEQADPPKVGLVGTALTDWPDLLPFLKWLQERKTKFSLSSLRADGLTEEMLSFLRQCGVRTITLALEGASGRIRDMASKKLDPEDFLRAVRLCAKFGVNHLRMYLIVGWPGETDADYDELEDFLWKVLEARGQDKKSKKFMRITLGASCLVPKPWTPFQWAPMASADHLDKVLKRLRKMVKPMQGVTLSGDNPAVARLQGILSLGDERIADLAEIAWELNGNWRKALTRWDVDEAEMLDHERDKDQVFPWDVIDTGVKKAFLWREWQRAKQAAGSPGCPPEGCQTCKVCGMAGFEE